MEKKSLKVVAVIFLIVLGMVLFFILKDKQNNNDELEFKKEYEKVNANEGAIQVTIPKDNSIVYLNTYEQLQQKISNKDSFVLYLGFPTCPWCRNIVPILLESAKENEIKNVYYINVRSLKNNSKEDYDNLHVLINDYLEGGTLYVPEVFFFQDGEIIGHHLGSVESQESAYVPLTETQKKELKDIYRQYLDKIK